MSEANPTRRTLLQGLVAALGGDQAGVLAALGRRARAVTAWVAPGAVSTSLSTADLDDLVAFAGVLVAGAEVPEAERGYLREHLEEQEPFQGEAYRRAAQVLAHLGGARFASLEVPARVALVRLHDLGRSVDRPGDRDDTRVIRTRVVADLISAYYGSPPGWALVGYAAFPGRCGALERYTRPDA